MFESYSNVFVISAGGVGNVAIPLVKGKLFFSTLDTTSPNYRELGFYGTVAHGQRSSLIKQLQHTIKERSKVSHSNHSRIRQLTIMNSPNWVKEMEQTLFNLAPIGFGRGSFRMSEIIRIGRIPVYLYQDYGWLPYEGTLFSPAVLGLMAKPSEIPLLYDKMNNLLSNSKLIDDYLSRIQKAYFYYTNEGILTQIDKFFHSPLTGGYLRCSEQYQQYKTEIRNDPIKKFMRLIS